jgi:hypothetical protein
MPTLLSGSDVDEQQQPVAPGLLNEGGPVSNDRGPLGMLFPSGPYGAMPGLNLGALRRGQLMDLSARLLAAGGPKPQGTSSTLSDIGGALGGAQESWQQRLPQAANAAMQLTQYQYQMQGRQALMKAMQEEGGPPKPGDSPTAAVAWYSRMARRMADAGPAGLPFATQFATLAETQHRALGDLKYEDGVITPADLQANPNIGPAGAYGAIGRDPNTGAPVVFQAKPRLTPEQSTSKGIELRGKFADEIKPGNTAALAYQAYKDINSGDTSRAADMQRAQLAGRMLGEGGTVPGLSPGEAKDLKDMVMEMFTNAGRLDPASRSRYNASVEKAAQYWKRHNSAILNYYKSTAPEGIDTSGYEDEWSGLLNNTQVPKPSKAPAYDPSKTVTYP